MAPAGRSLHPVQVFVAPAVQSRLDSSHCSMTSFALFRFFLQIGYHGNTIVVRQSRLDFSQSEPPMAGECCVKQQEAQIYLNNTFLLFRLHLLVRNLTVVICWAFFFFF